MIPNEARISKNTALIRPPFLCIETADRLTLCAGLIPKGCLNLVLPRTNDLVVAPWQTVDCSGTINAIQSENEEIEHAGAREQIPFRIRKMTDASQSPSQFPGFTHFVGPVQYVSEVSCV